MLSRRTLVVATRAASTASARRRVLAVGQGNALMVSSVPLTWGWQNGLCFGIGGISSSTTATTLVRSFYDYKQVATNRHCRDTLGLQQHTQQQALCYSDTAKKESSLTDRYQLLVQKGQVHHDEHQWQALQELERLRSDLLSYQLPPRRTSSKTTTTTTVSSSSFGGSNGLFSGWFGSRNNSNGSTLLSSSMANYTFADPRRRPPRGVYLHGGVGSGKTMLMNLFFDSLNKQEPWASEKQKIHYHRFMAMIHQAMHQARQNSSQKKSGQHVSDAVLPQVIKQTAARGRLLCLDEFQVTDVADALILQRLFTGLWQQEGCIVVATSNRAPSDLYQGGLQRDRFLPFIDLLQDYCQEVSMWESAVDYRLIQRLESGQVNTLYFVGETGLRELDKLFYDELVGPNNVCKPAQLAASEHSSRTIAVPQASMAQGMARFSFNDLCTKALGASDYLVLGQHFSTIVVDQIPKLTLNEINCLRRFILLVDALYESNVKLILHTQQAHQPQQIFHVEDVAARDKYDEVFAFDRTVSRLQEMSSKSYLHRKWTGHSDMQTNNNEQELQAQAA